MSPYARALAQSYKKYQFWLRVPLKEAPGKNLPHPTSMQDARLARALSFSVCMRDDTSSEEEEDEGDGEPVPPCAGARELAVPHPSSAAAGPAAPVVPKPAVHEGTIQVFLRVRPPSQAEQGSGDESCITDLTSNAVTFEPKELAGKAKTAAHRSAHQITSETFFFDGVLGQSAPQKAVYDTSIAACVSGVVGGRSGLIFAFGITNAGKTYTIQGTEAEPGVLPRALGQLLAVTKDEPDTKVTLSFMEVYNEHIYDLLAADTGGGGVLPGGEGKGVGGSQMSGTGGGGGGLTTLSRPALQLKDDNRSRVHVRGLTTVDIASIEQAARLLAHGTLSRQIAHTDTNHESSRSHSIVTMTLHRGDEHSTELMVVDLAGERGGHRPAPPVQLACPRYAIAPF
jgi:hypothetical protein